MQKNATYEKLISTAIVNPPKDAESQRYFYTLLGFFEKAGIDLTSLLQTHKNSAADRQIIHKTISDAVQNAFQRPLEEVLSLQNRDERTLLQRYAVYGTLQDRFHLSGAHIHRWFIKQGNRGTIYKALEQHHSLLEYNFDYMNMFKELNKKIQLESYETSAIAKE